MIIKEYKNFKIMSSDYNLFVIKPIGKGTVKKALRTKYISITQAMEAIDVFLESGD